MEKSLYFLGLFLCFNSGIFSDHKWFFTLLFLFNFIEGQNEYENQVNTFYPFPDKYHNIYISCIIWIYIGQSCRHSSYIYGLIVKASVLVCLIDLTDMTCSKNQINNTNMQRSEWSWVCSLILIFSQHSISMQLTLLN